MRFAAIPILMAFAISAFPVTTVKAANSSPFTDTGGPWAWAETAVDQLSSSGITTGYPDHTFHPGAPISRAEFAVFIARTLHVPGDPAETFPDTQNHWARSQIGALKHRNVVHGLEDGTFGPDANITRAQMATMICNLLNLPKGGTSPLTDIQSSWAKDEINAVYQAGIIQGDPDTGSGPAFRPDDFITRAETAIVIAKLQQKLPSSLISPPYKGEVLGFTAVDYPGDVNSVNSLQSFYPHINDIATFSYGIDAAGHLSGQAPADTVSFAVYHSVAPYVLIHNYDEQKQNFNPDLARSVLQSPAARQTLEQNILTVAGQGNYRGVNIDLELVPPTEQSDFLAFLQDLHLLLAPKGLQLTVDVPAKTGESQPWDDAYDYDRIGAIADRVIPMTYDYHWYNEQEAGPVAPIGWVDQVLQYSTAHVPKEKILLGIADYGYDWSSTGSKLSTASVIQKSVRNLISQYGGQATLDPASDEYTYAYSDSSGTAHTVWFEEEQAAADRVDLARTYQVAGIAIWRLGFENETFWNNISPRMGH